MPRKNGGERDGPAKQAEQASEISFDFIKGAFFRVIAVDGGFGGLGPTGRNIHMAVYSERRPLPRKTVHPLMEDGSLGNELKDKRESRESFVREIEADLVFDLPTAISIHEWLGGRINELAKLTGNFKTKQTKKRE